MGAAFAGFSAPHLYHRLQGSAFRGTSEEKGVLYQSVRGMDLYILVDVVNYSDLSYVQF